MSQKNILAIVVAIVVIIIVVAFTFNNTKVEAPSDTNNNSKTEESTTENGSGSPTTPATPSATVKPQTVSTKPVPAATVSYNAEGYMTSQFTPATVTITQGQSVLFVNNTNEMMWVASNAHPTHSALPGFDQRTSVGRGGTYLYTFKEIGKWEYHNHLNPTRGGMVIVKQAQ
ncbi:hypothetical protein A2906_00160 [Candidatus Nomurabacteria bacterium RIFCSPLOWO2_01_FULL_37_25]|nr:MAG: hypothetical protein A2906_00160 [Candidatus Nomurabacteria bacterium RIFCSPLOWO2_01_FULL_37_25]